MYKFIYLFLFLTLPSVYAQETQIVYLSGTGAENTKEWEFMCSEGMNCGSWSSIEVPSHWEQQGFGEYNYGLVPFDQRLKETGTYRYDFDVPESWENNTVNIVFEGVMTDATVSINGKSAGEKHQGAFYQFDYDITSLLNFGEENTLEVVVDKFSANHSVNMAERQADYWVFGGIFRPVYLQVLPKEYIDHVAIDAKADGSFQTKAHLFGIENAASMTLNIHKSDGEMVDSFSNSIGESRNEALVNGTLDNVLPWSPEFPNLYHFEFELKDIEGNIIHAHTERSGFRTVEVREQDGIYVNGVKIKMKGVNRHTFHPDYGRTSEKAFSIADVNRIKDMNMNAVRMAHYPPDKHFLEVADSLGLFVIDELAGWQHPGYDTEVGRKLLTEMIHDDVNHPSIILWSNANEGGWNPELDADFKKLDIQQREAIHPWAVHEKINAAHYFDYDYLTMDNFTNRKIFLPTEFLHGLYDGGHGAGLEDFWDIMYDHPLTAGGFLWSFADECVMRSDTTELDCDGNHAPDGILSPYFQKEGSFFSIREIWSPLFFEERYITSDFNGVFDIENRFYYTDLNQLRIEYQWINLPSEGMEEEILKQGEISAASIPPQYSGELEVVLFDGWQESDVLSIKAYDPHNRLIHTWTWPVKTPMQFANEHIPEINGSKPQMEETDSAYRFKSGSFSIEINKANGSLIKAVNESGTFPIHGGPFINEDDITCENVELISQKTSWQVKSDCIDNTMHFQWTIKSDGWLDLSVQYELPENKMDYAGISFHYPENEVESVRYIGDGPYRVWKNRLAGPQFGLWDKTYNNTITGYSGYEYPEFKGFYSNFYKAEFNNKKAPDFSVYSKEEDLFLRLFNPENPPDPVNTRLNYPAGDVGFMHGILPIGTKFKGTDVLGPKSWPYDYLNRRLDGQILSMSLTFDFSSK